MASFQCLGYSPTLLDAPAGEWAMIIHMVRSFARSAFPTSHDYFTLLARRVCCDDRCMHNESPGPDIQVPVLRRTQGQSLIYVTLRIEYSPVSIARRGTDDEVSACSDNVIISSNFTPSRHMGERRIGGAHEVGRTNHSRRILSEAPPSGRTAPTDSK